MGLGDNFSRHNCHTKNFSSSRFINIINTWNYPVHYFHLFVLILPVMLLLSTIKLVIKESQTNISHTSFWEIELASIALKRSQIKIQTFNRFKNQTTWCCSKARRFKTPRSRIMIIHTFFTCSIIMLYEYLCRSSYRIGKGVSPNFYDQAWELFFWRLSHDACVPMPWKWK